MVSIVFILLIVILIIFLLVIVVFGLSDVNVRVGLDLIVFILVFIVIVVDHQVDGSRWCLRFGMLVCKRWRKVLFSYLKVELIGLLIDSVSLLNERVVHNRIIVRGCEVFKCVFEVFNFHHEFVFFQALDQLYV